MEGVGRIAQGLHGGFDSRDVAVVVSPPHINEVVKPTLELVPMIEAIRKKVRGLPVSPDQDPVLVVPEGRCGQPDRIPLLIDVLAKEIPDDLEYPSLIRRTPTAEQGLFAEPGIKAHPKAFQIPFELLEHDAGGIFTNDRKTLAIREIDKFLAVLLPQRGREIPDILPMIPFLGKDHIQSKALSIPGEHRASQHLDLRPSVIDVKLPLHGKPHRRQQIRQCIAHRGTTAMPDVEGPRRVRADELNLRLFPCTDLTPTILVPRPEDFRTHLLPETFGEEEVKVPRTSDLHPLHDERIKNEAVLKEFRNVPGLAAERPGEAKGNGGCQIAKGGLDRVLPDHLESLDRRHLT